MELKAHDWRDEVKTDVLVKDGDVTFSRTQDCTPIVEFAQMLHNQDQHGSSDFKFAARIPNVILEKYANDNNLLFSEVMQNPEHIRAILNDPSLKAFRIWPGKV
jgi:hypothetical protein